MSSETAENRTDEHKVALVERILSGDLTAAEACREQELSDSQLQEWVAAYRRTKRHAMEEQLTEALSARGLPAAEAAISEFSGSLDSLALAELIQTIEYGRKDAQIRVDHDGQQSHIWCEQGQVVDARSGPLAGSAALYRLLSLRHGRVYARFVGAERLRTIHASTAALLLEAAKRYDECRELRQRIGDTRAVYVASPSAWAAEARLAPEIWQLLRAFDGVSSVERVVSTRTSPELETLTDIAGLLDQGLLTDQPLPSSAPRLPLRSERTSSTSSNESSFLPFIASLRARLTHAGPRRRLWLSAAAGASVVACAFVIGFWSVRPGSDSRGTKPPAVASANDWASAARDGNCPEGFARLAGSPLVAPAESGTTREPRISPFCLARAEVTVREYEACVAANGCTPADREGEPPSGPSATANPAPSSAAAERPAPATAQLAPALQCNSGQAGRERHPINCVTFQQAQQFCAWRGGRLPREAEWEHAAEEVTPDVRETHPGTLPVGTFPSGANPEGVLDLLGNVSEWTTGQVSLRSVSGGDAPRQLHAVLGGGLQPGASRLGSHAARQYMNANARGSNVGFRCAFDP
jgi:transposase-like protein